MMTLFVAAAAAAAQPSPTAPAGPMTQHEMNMQMGKDAAHKDMDCCKDCCKDMAEKHDGHAEHDRHTSE